MSFSTADIKSLREATGAGVMDAKKALEESRGDIKKAKDWIKQKGLARAAKKADRETKEGYIAAYVHSNGKVAAMVEILCETDFVARGEEFRSMAKNIAMQVASMAPKDVKELLSQEFIRDPKQTVDELVKSLSGKIGENLVVSRFERFKIGE